MLAGIPESNRPLPGHQVPITRSHAPTAKSFSSEAAIHFVVPSWCVTHTSTANTLHRIHLMLLSRILHCIQSETSERNGELTSGPQRLTGPMFVQMIVRLKSQAMLFIPLLWRFLLCSCPHRIFSSYSPGWLLCRHHASGAICCGGHLPSANS